MASRQCVNANRKDGNQNSNSGGAGPSGLHARRDRCQANPKTISKVGGTEGILPKADSLRLLGNSRCCTAHAAPMRLKGSYNYGVVACAAIVASRLDGRMRPSLHEDLPNTSISRRVVTYLNPIYRVMPCLRLISRENSVTKFNRVPQPSWPAMARPPSAPALLGPGFQAADNSPPPKAPP